MQPDPIIAQGCYHLSISALLEALILKAMMPLRENSVRPRGIALTVSEPCLDVVSSYHFSLCSRLYVYFVTLQAMRIYIHGQMVVSYIYSYVLLIN